MNSLNPYESPPNQETKSKPEFNRSDRLSRIGETILLWERLRVLYNGLLFAIVMVAALVSPTTPFRNPLVLVQLVVLAIIANVCFCAGPIVSAYICWLGASEQSGRMTTYILFGIGTVFAAILAIFVLATM